MSTMGYAVGADGMRHRAYRSALEARQVAEIDEHQALIALLDVMIDARHTAMMTGTIEGAVITAQSARREVEIRRTVEHAAWAAWVTAVRNAA